MATFSQVDLDRLERAIASGALTVRYDDGRQVTYRSLEELFQARNLVRRCLGLDAGPTRKVAAHSKGVEGPIGGDHFWTRIP